MQRTRPTSITVIAILQLIFGGLCVLGYVCGGLYQAFGGQAMFTSLAGNNAKMDEQLKIQKEFQEEAEKAEAAVPGGKLTEYGRLGVDMLLTLMMIVGGIGLLKMKPWSHKLTIFYAVLSILMKIIGAVLAIFYVIPAVSAFLKEFGAKGQQQQFLANAGQLGVYIALIQPFIMMIYPAIVLIIMLLSKNRAAFAGEIATPTDAARADEQFEAEDRWGRG